MLQDAHRYYVHKKRLDMAKNKLFLFLSPIAIFPDLSVHLSHHKPVHERRHKLLPATTSGSPGPAP